MAGKPEALKAQDLEILKRIRQRPGALSMPPALRLKNGPLPTQRH